MENITIKKPETIERSEFLKQVGIGFGAIMLMQCIQGCAEGEIPDPNPTTGGTKLDITIDLNSATYSALKNKGGFAVITASKIIAAQTSNGEFIAVSSACTHQGTTVNYRANTNDFLCPNHGSIFKSDGSVQTGPATTALKKYSTSADLSNNKLRIFE